MAKLTDEDIIKLVKGGNSDYFGLLVERYKDSLYSFIFYSVKDEGSAGDIFQDTMLKALCEIKNYREEGKFKPWLFTIARNKITDYFRKVSKISSLPEDEDAHAFPSQENTEKTAFSNISLEEILNFVNALPPKDREIILLRQYLSFKEIAATLDCPLGTVLARLNRAIKKLQKCMGDNYAM